MPKDNQQETARGTRYTIPPDYALAVIGFPEGGGGGTPGWYGDFAHCPFQSCCISTLVGDFFLAKSPVFLGEAKQPTRLKDAINFSS